MAQKDTMVDGNGHNWEVQQNKQGHTRPVQFSPQIIHQANQSSLHPIAKPIQVRLRWIYTISLIQEPLELIGHFMLQCPAKKWNTEDYWWLSNAVGFKQGFFSCNLAIAFFMRAGILSCSKEAFAILPTHLASTTLAAFISQKGKDRNAHVVTCNLSKGSVHILRCVLTLISIYVHKYAPQEKIAMS